MLHWFQVKGEDEIPSSVLLRRSVERRVRASHATVCRYDVLIGYFPVGPASHGVMVITMSYYDPHTISQDCAEIPNICSHPILYDLLVHSHIFAVRCVLAV